MEKELNMVEVGGVKTCISCNRLICNEKLDAKDFGVHDSCWDEHNYREKNNLCTRCGKENLAKYSWCMKCGIDGEFKNYRRDAKIIVDSYIYK